MLGPFIFHQSARFITKGIVRSGMEGVDFMIITEKEFDMILEMSTTHVKRLHITSHVQYADFTV